MQALAVLALPLPKTVAAVRLLRPSHWIKNLLVFAPLFFSFQVTPERAVLAVTIFAAFCLASSSIYVFNDIIDAPKDRQHPKKRHRPVASGRITPVLALGIGLMALGCATYLASYLPLTAGSILGAYVIINAAYSFWLKKLVIVDVMIIALGFVLRIIAGGVAVGVPISHWIILCTFFVSLFLGFGKRKNECLTLKESSRHHRNVLEHYTPDFLNQLLAITAAMTIMGYALYTIDEATIRHFGSSNLVYTIPFVLYALFRYFHIMYNQSDGGDPTQIFWRDYHIMSAFGLWIISFLLLAKVS